MNMSIERLDGHGVLEGSSPAPSTPIIENPPQTPRLDVCEFDSSPFSHNFSDLLDGLGLVSEKFAGDESPDVSYYLENITNIKDIMPDWEHDEIEEIVFMSVKRSPILPEDKVAHTIPSAVLSDFSIDDSDTVPGLSFRRCVRKDTGRVYAWKSARKNLGSCIRERSVLAAVTEKDIPFVAHLKWMFQDEEQHIWVIDYHDKCGLLEFVQQRGSLDSVGAAFYASEVIVALASLHDIGIVYQNLSPKTVSFDSDGHIVLSDFSHADFISVTEKGSIPKKSLAAIMPEYAAPEMVLGWARNAASDCWSFGVLVSFMLLGTHPFGKPETGICERVVKYGIPADSLRFISPIARDLISKCLQRNPAIRPNVEQIKRHAYFSSVDWLSVASREAEAPLFPISSPIAPSTTSESRLSLQAPIISAEPVADPDRRRSIVSSNGHHRKQSISNTMSDPSLEFFKQTVRISVPSIVPEEEEVASESESGKLAGSSESQSWQPDNAQKADRLAHFWDTFDKDGECSVTSQEFGELGSRTKKLRKHRSSIQPPLRFNFSTSSFQMKLKRKPRSAGALRDLTPKAAQKIPDLPNGIHQVGSGIGFTYNLPAQALSKRSVRSFAPSCSFPGVFSVKNLGRGLGSRKVKATSASNLSLAAVTPIPVATDEGSSFGATPRPKKVGSGTFIRDMYRTPSWIVSPPDSLPSPMLLVSADCDSISPQTSPEPLTPATLVEVGDLGVILGMEYVSVGSLDLAPDSTLRLVPQSDPRLSFIDTSLSCVSVV